MPTEKKRITVAQLAERLSRSHLVILTDYRGLNMKDLTALRRSLEKSGIGYHVAKNTLLVLALREAAISGLEPYLDGPTAVAFAYEDPVTAAKALKEQLAHMPVLQIKGGWMQGQVLSPEGVHTLATLPPRPIMLGQVVGMLQFPMANLVGTLSGVMRQLLYVLQARVGQGGGAEAPSEAA